LAKDVRVPTSLCSLCGDSEDGLIAIGLVTCAGGRGAIATLFACCVLEGVRRAATKISADAVTRRSEEVYIRTLFRQSLSYHSHKYLVLALYQAPKQLTHNRYIPPHVFSEVA